MPATLDDLATPVLLLDTFKVARNLERMRAKLAPHGVVLRPHMKTAKSVAVMRDLMGGPETPITVSTLKEAEVYAAAGVKDITYAVGIAPPKLDRVAAIRKTGCDLSLILDSVDAAKAVAAKSRETGDAIPALIELDADGHRAGLQSSRGEELVAIGRALVDGGAMLKGVLVHAGESYAEPGEAAIVAAAAGERATAVGAAALLRAAGLPCPTVSVGSTPTATFGKDFSGITEVRAGVFMFFDLVMQGLGVCGLDDIAAGVLATVIGHQPDKGWTLIDAGWMAMSRDRGTSALPVDQGYGVVCDPLGKPYPDQIVIKASQEHGIVAVRPGSAAKPLDLPLGAKVLILPNHACATAAQYDGYVLTDARRPGEVTGAAERFRGW